MNQLSILGFVEPPGDVGILPIMIMEDPDYMMSIFAMPDTEFTDMFNRNILPIIQEIMKIRPVLMKSMQ